MSEERKESIRKMEWAANGEQGIRELIRDAGPRPPVPSQELMEVRRAAKDEWRELVRKEGERKRFQRRRDAVALAASVLVAIALGWWLMPREGPVSPDIIARVELLQGEVRDRRGLALFGGGQLATGTVLETLEEGGEPSRVALRLVGGQSVRLDTDSRVRLVTGSRLELERGGVYVDTGSATLEGGIEIHTLYGRIRDIGTQFEVRVDERSGSELMVRVREGEISLEQDSESYSAMAGEELSILGGVVDRATVQPHGDVWDWVLDVTPSMDIEGAELAVYLDWVSRETGLHLGYAEESLAESAARIRLHGTIEGMTPKESLSVVLPASGLGYEVQNGSLLITISGT